MPIFTKSDSEFVFIHIPKTGGTSIETWLSKQCTISYYSKIIPTFLKCTPQHFTYSYIKFLEPSRDFDSFTIVRNPYDRAESEYFFRERNQLPQFRPDFSFWMLKHLQNAVRNPHHFDNHFMPQSYFFEDDKTKVYRYEDGLKGIIDDIANRFQIQKPTSVPHHNASPRERVNWSSELLDKFNKYYSIDFEKLNYQIRN